MTDFPELQHALIDAADRRYGRAARVRRLVRPALALAACAAALIAVVVLAGSPGADREQPASPLSEDDALARNHAVFRRAATPADALPDPDAFATAFLLDEDREAFNAARTRLVAREGEQRLYVVGTTVEGSPGFCTVVFTGRDVRRGGCSGLLPGPGMEVQSFASEPAKGRPGLLLALVVDGIDALDLTFFDGTERTVPVRDNAVYTELDRKLVSVGYASPDGSYTSGSPGTFPPRPG